MRHRVAGRVTTALVLAAASLAWGAPAMADVPGFEVNIGESPATFTVDKGPRTLTAVISTDRGGACRKVRWALVVRTDGVSLDQLRIGRVEEDGDFDVQAQAQGDTAVLVDTQLDPGQLCRDRTVTGRWDIAFTGPDDGSVTFEARAADVNGRVLSSATATSRVVSPVADQPSAEPTESESPSTDPEAEQEPGEQEGAADPQQDDETPTGATALQPTSGTPSVLGPGLVIGGMLVFLGVGLLMRIRTRNRQAAAETALPTGFYPRRR